MAHMSSSPFKAIIVGSGPIGLVAAHALTRCNIDFTVLELRQSPVIEAGANLVLMPLGMRALYQLDLYDEFNEISDELDHIDYIDHEGRNFAKLNWFHWEKEHFGAFPRMVSRHNLTKMLYNKLPASAQAKFHPNKKVTGVNTTPDGVVVECSDNTSYAGSIVIGADGVHSVVRRNMRELALASGSLNVNKEKPYLTTFRVLWIRFPRPAQVRTGLTCETHGRDAGIQTFMGKDTGVCGLYERLDKPTKERMVYTEEDEKALIERWGHLPVSKDGSLTLRQGYDSRIDCGLVSLEEGVVSHWSWEDRIVLVGDAAHKFTPSTGTGCNNGIIDVVALVNELDRAVKQNPGRRPDKAQMVAAFKAYQKCRFDAVGVQEKQAGQATSLATWRSPIFKLVDRYLIPLDTIQKLLAKSAAADTSAAPAFEFATAQEHLIGSVPWKTPPVKA